MRTRPCKVTDLIKALLEMLLEPLGEWLLEWLLKTPGRWLCRLLGRDPGPESILPLLAGLLFWSLLLVGAYGLWRLSTPDVPHLPAAQRQLLA